MYAREAGLVAPTAMTSAAYHEFVEWTDHDDKEVPGSGQSTAGRARDVVLVAVQALSRAAGRNNGPGRQALAGVQIPVTLWYVKRGGNGTPETGHLKAVIDGGDDGQPCVTLLEPGED